MGFFNFIYRVGAAISNSFNPAAQQARDERDAIRKDHYNYIKDHERDDPVKIQNARNEEIQISDNKINYLIDKSNKSYNDYLIPKNQYFNDQNNLIQPTFNVLANKTKDQIDNLINEVTSQNQLLTSQIKENRANENHSKKVKSEFQKKEVEKLTTQNQIIWYIFYVLVLVLGLIMWYFNSVNMVLQIIIFHVLLVYPFLIYYFELFLYIIFAYSKSFFESTPYNKVYLGYY